MRNSAAILAGITSSAVSGTAAMFATTSQICAWPGRRPSEHEVRRHHGAVQASRLARRRSYNVVADMAAVPLTALL